MSRDMTPGATDAGMLGWIIVGLGFLLEIMAQLGVVMTAPLVTIFVLAALCSFCYAATILLDKAPKEYMRLRGEDRRAETLRLHEANAPFVAKEWPELVGAPAPIKEAHFTLSPIIGSVTSVTVEETPKGPVNHLTIQGSPTVYSMPPTFQEMRHSVQPGPNMYDPRLRGDSPSVVQKRYINAPQEPKQQPVDQLGRRFFVDLRTGRQDWFWMDNRIGYWRLEGSPEVFKIEGAVPGRLDYCAIPIKAVYL